MLQSLNKIILYTTLCICSCIFSSSCGGDDRPILLQINLEADIEIPAGLNSLETHFFILRDLNTQAQVFLQGINPDQIDEILPAEARMQNRTGNVDYAVFSEVIVRAIQNNNQSNNQEIFFQTFIPLNQERDLTLFGSLLDVKDIFTQDLYDLEFRFRFRNFTPTSFDNRIFMTFNVYGK